MANLRTNNLSGSGGRNAIDGSVYFRGYIDGTKSDYLKTADLDDYDMGTGDFTFECWIRVAKNQGDYAGIFGMYDYDNAGMLFQIGNTGVLRLVNPGSIDQTGSTVLWGAGGTMGSWHHIAVTRSGSTLKGFINGISEIGLSYTNGIDFANGGGAVIGVTDIVDHPGDYNIRGYVSNLRLIKGSALYTANFTPPTEKLTAVDGTVLLCCQDSDDPTQEATGKTLTGYGTLGGDKTEGNLLVNTLDWTGAASSYSTTMPTNWTAGNGAQVQYESGGAGGGAANRKLRLRNDGSNSYIYQTIPTVIGQEYLIDLWYEAQNSSLAVKWLAGTSAAGTQNGSSQWNVGSDGTKYRRSGSFQATATTTYITFQIISGTDGASVYIDDIQVKVFNPKAPKVLPSVGVDEGVVFNGDTKVNSQGYMYFPTGDTSQRGRGRAVSFAGYLSSPGSTVEEIIYFDIATSGTSLRFGDLGITQGATGAAVASGTRAVYGGGWTSPGVDISYITIATTGNSIDFGANRTGLKGSYAPGLSNSTRGLFISSQNHPNYQALTDYVTIATTGTCTEFGDVVDNRYGGAASASPTRGIYAGGVQGASSPGTNFISYCTIATTGSWANFGDLSNGSGGYRYTNGSSSNTRSIVYGGNYPGDGNEIDYITIATLGDSVDFGDAIKAGTHRGGFSNNIRGGAIGGYYPAADFNTIEYVNIATTGNGIDWGDLTQTRSYNQGTTSDSHGGL